MSRKNSFYILLLASVFFIQASAQDLTSAVLGSIPYNARVAVQVMQLKMGGQDVSKKNMYLRISDDKPVNKKAYPDSWRLGDKNKMFEIKQIKDVLKDSKAQFTFYKAGNKIGLQANNGHFMSVRRNSHKKYDWKKAKKTWRHKDEGTVLIDDETKNFDKWSEWILEAVENEYGSFVLRHPHKNSQGYINAPSGHWAMNVLWTAKAQDASNKGNFQKAEKGDALVFKIHILSGPSIDDQIKTPVETKSSEALQSLPNGTVVGLLLYDLNKPRYLKIDGKELKISNDKKISDNECRFKVLRDGNWIGFRSLAKDRTVQSNPKRHVEFKNNNFKDYEKWALEPVDFNNHRSPVRLRSRASKGYLTIHSDGRAWTRPEKTSRPAIKSEAQLLRIVKVNEVVA